MWNTMVGTGLLATVLVSRLKSQVNTPSGEPS